MTFSTLAIVYHKLLSFLYNASFLINSNQPQLEQTAQSHREPQQVNSGKLRDLNQSKRAEEQRSIDMLNLNHFNFEKIG